MPRRRRLFAGIRTRLFLVSLVLLIIPWMGYQYVREMKSFLLQGQEKALLSTARAIATVLHDRPDLMRAEPGAPSSKRALYAFPLPGFIRLDGDANDWGTVADNAPVFSDERFLACTAAYDPESLSFRQSLGYRRDSLYLLIRVLDDAVVIRDRRYRRLDSSDHLRLILRQEGADPERYIFVFDTPGRLSVYRMDLQWRYPLTGEPVYRISGEWTANAQGYSMEVRIPRFLLRENTQLGIAVGDVDDYWSRNVERVVSSQPPPGYAPVLFHSPEFARILRGLDRPQARISIYDRARRIQATVGRIQDATGSAPASASRTLLDRLYDGILRLPANWPADARESTDPIPELVIQALKGEEGVRRRHDAAGAGMETLAAATPIYGGDAVIGAVVTEQSSSEVVALQSDVLRKVVSVTLLAFGLVALALLLFAWRILLRIRRLSHATEQAIGPDGRVRNDHLSTGTRARDELGDLARAISDMLGRLAQHTRYLESMPDTLAHELSNPLNVVNSSLENLQAATGETPETKYITRAKGGVRRLRRILANLTEAANLEEALRGGQQEVFDLSELVQAALEGYRLATPERRFVIDPPSPVAPVRGVPDHLAQMLDKLIDNAVDFAAPDTPIHLRVSAHDQQVRLEVRNHGSSLPAEVPAGRLFDPMVSIGKKHAAQSRLGLGLYVVKLIAEFHGGRAEASNHADGVRVSVVLPRASEPLDGGVRRRAAGDSV